MGVFDKFNLSNDALRDELAISITNLSGLSRENIS
jgi:hypothetical protein